MRDINLIIVLFILTSEYTDCLAQDYNLKTKIGVYTDNQNKVDTSFVFNADTDFLVVDGIFVEKGSKFADLKNSSSVIQIWDKAELARIGVCNTNGSYTFFNSSLTPFHLSIYKRVELPSSLRSFNVPIIINGRLLTPDKYNQAVKLHIKNVESIIFIRSNIKGLNISRRLAYGAIKIKYNYLN